MQVADINPFVRYAGRNFLSSTPMRRARDQRIFFITSNESIWNIAGKEHTFSRGSLFFLPAGTPYSMKSSETFSLVAVNFDFTQSPSSPQNTFATLTEAEYNAIGPLEHICFEKNSFSTPMFVSGKLFEHRTEDLVSEFEQKKIFYREKTSAILKDILFEMLRMFTTDSSGENLAVDKMITFICENYMLPITNKDIASCVQYHEYHANRLMLRYTGTTLHKYLTDFRIERAKMYLASTKLSASEIAEKTGLGTVSRFSECFKKATGFSPLAYRKENFRLM